MSRLAIFLATGACAGYAPIAPGTAGSALGLLVYGLLAWTGLRDLELAVIAGLGASGIWAGAIAERHFGGVDPGPVVIDEVVGMLITLAFVPVGPVGAGVGFVLFRLFDIIKPFPAGHAERLHGGFGVMADDAVAGVYANLGLRAVLAVTGWR
jgi:phosphatidylglycerophosphatase A